MPGARLRGVRLHRRSIHPMPETTRDPYTGLWTARVERDGRWYIGVGRTEKEAVQAAERKAGQ